MQGKLILLLQFQESLLHAGSLSHCPALLGLQSHLYFLYYDVCDYEDGLLFVTNLISVCICNYCFKI